MIFALSLLFLFFAFFIFFSFALPLPVPCLFFAFSLPLIFLFLVLSPFPSSLRLSLLIYWSAARRFFPSSPPSRVQLQISLSVLSSSLKIFFSSLISSLTPPSLRAEPASRSCLLALIIRLLLLLGPASQFSSFISFVGVSFSRRLSSPLIPFLLRQGGAGHPYQCSYRPSRPPPVCGFPRPPCSILPVTSSRSSGSLLPASPCCEAPLPSASASASSPLPVFVVRRQESHAWQSTRP